MAALKASLAASPKPADKIKVKAGKGTSAMDRKRAEGQRDMLLPITGSKSAGEAALKIPSRPSKARNTTRKVG